ncbi:MAG TPA: hypothetical protein VFM25_13385, partial [Verrucomicrobiae bacterium]|nr:hypothetical protein [Verrucomicrobiae bacterium]
AATFTEGSVVQMDKNSEGYSKGARSGYASAMPSIAIADESMSSFGELVFTAKVTVEYTVRTK